MNRKKQLLPLLVRDRQDFKIETGHAIPKQTNMMASKIGNFICPFLLDLPVSKADASPDKIPFIR